MAKIHKIDPIKYIVLPHDCFASDQGQATIAEQMQAEFKKAGVRIPIVRGATMAKGARHSRLALMHSVLANSPDGYPYMMVHESCANLIRTLPELPYSATDVEDVDTDVEDHAYDSSSLGIMTIKPRFVDATLVQMKSNTHKPFKKTWQQTSDGLIQSDDILSALGRTQRSNSHNGEY